MFTVKQKITNNSEKKYSFYPYGQIIRNEIPKITNFFILHEGPLGVFDSELVEEDYDDIQEKPFSVNADKGFVGITDKFWITSLIPQENRKFRADFDYKNKFRTNFIETNATEIGANETKVVDMKKVFGVDRNVITPDNNNIEATFVLAKKLDGDESNNTGNVQMSLNFKEQ